MDDELQRLLDGLSPRQLDFVSARLSTTTDAEAARRVNLHPVTVYGWRNIADVRRAVQLSRQQSLRVLQVRLERLAGEAIDVLERELHNPSPRSRRIDVAIYVLDRVLGKPTERVQLESEGDRQLAALVARLQERIPDVEDVRPSWDVAVEKPPSLAPPARKEAGHG